MLAMLLNGIKRRWWVLLLVLSAIGIGYTMTREQTRVAEVTKVNRGSMRQFIIEDAKTRLAREYVVSLPVNATLQRLPWQVGDHVQQGQPLVGLQTYARYQELAGLQAKLHELDSQRRGVQVTQPQAEDLRMAQLKIHEAGIQLQQAQQQSQLQRIELQEQSRVVRRQTRLHTDGVVDKATLEQQQKQLQLQQQQLKLAQIQEKAASQARHQAELALKKLKRTRHDNEYQYAVFQAQKNQIGTQLKIKQDELRQSQIVAPVSGPILEIYTPDAGPQMAGTRLLKIGDLSSLELETDVLSEEIHLLKLGLPVEISGKALQDKILPGHVSRIFPSGFTKLSALGVEQQRIKVLVQFKETPQHVYPGTSLEVRLITAQRPNTLKIPERSIFKQAGQWHVFKLDGEQKAQLQPVVIGLKNEAEVEILKGLQVGEAILLEPDNKLQPGIKIQTP